MKTEEFSFESETDLDEAMKIIIKMREERPAPKLAQGHQPSYVLVALGDEGAEFERRLREHGISHEITYQGSIPDNKFIHA